MSPRWNPNPDLRTGRHVVYTLHVHLVFVIKYRRNVFADEMLTRYEEITREVRADFEADLQQVNGEHDHVHLLVQYRADISHSDLVRHIKGRSSKWVNELLPNIGHFSWQDGYGGFTVSKSVVPEVEAYISRQKARHKRQDFRSEFLELLRRHGIDFDENDVFK